MYYKRQELKYNHYLYKDKFLIGVSKNISEEEASLFVNSPMLMYEQNVYGKILKLDRDKRSAIMNALEKWENNKSKESTFVGLYWDIILDCILAVYGKTTMDLAHEMMKMRYFEKYDEKTLFDNIEQMRNNKENVREQGQELVTQICYCCKMTESLVQNGQGVLYYCEGGNDYTTEKVNEYCNNHDSIILKDMIADITGVEKSEIIEIPMQVAIKRKRMENKIYDFLDIILDELIKNRE
ncbi:hypothetical protein FDB37_13495 [Clostridium botulinum]|nr:hypothetical protein [Clostridium botulinum]